MTDDIEILQRLGHADAALLGAGNEARVYAMGPDHVVRIMKAGATLRAAEARAAMLDEIARHAADLPFRTPEVERVVAMEGRVLAIEKRLPGVPVGQLLEHLQGEERRNLLENYLGAARHIGGIGLVRDRFGPLLDGEGLRSSSWNGFLKARLATSARACPDDLRPAVLAAAGTALPEPERPALVHLDYFPGNVLAENGSVSAVLDFGPATLLGDDRMEAWSAVAYLDPEISPQARPEDREQALDWLRRCGLLADYEKARRWLAAYWSFAADDEALMGWCRRILQDQAGGSSLPLGR
ncbi:phosphotransferase family protein [Devosia honganensis]|uniref:Phosphotransferase family protein n=1 Tax=Devosia honganensis TaxID=1610527 RepID=A0ABV7X2K4_9HYPH